ncbi:MULTISPECIES: alpha/beta fold hydrolase [unclassified Hyphomicrobium]|uniref:alpha/beta fold hydrolase n=1 Tax=unclassified Hyphomicrobium TaxID=2619925 RepID=UPI000213F852|nr:MULTISPECIES: alpha/beta hydrolase [unclassified Hyphomicrobium]CCB63429.1 PydB [Hyphomicrobium sp. MC1]
MLFCQGIKFEFEGVPVHVVTGGSGFPLLLIHGSGPGASTYANWRLVLEPLMRRYQIFGMDLIGFGASGRRAAPPYFDIDFWIRQCRAMIDRMPGEKIGVVGHSLSGALALKLAAEEPRISKVLTTGSMGAAFAINEGTIRCWSFPNDRAELVALAETLIYDRKHITEAYIDNRIETLWKDKAYRDYFMAMFAGDRQRFVNETLLSSNELRRIKIPVSMLHGRNDIAFPPDVTMRIADALPQADVALLAHCSHSIALEFPEKLLSACHTLFGE